MTDSKFDEVADMGIIAALECLQTFGSPVGTGGNTMESRVEPDLRLVATQGRDGGQRLTVHAGGGLVLDIVSTGDGNPSVVTFVGGAWVSHLLLAAVVRRWSFWGKPEQSPRHERRALPGRRTSSRRGKSTRPAHSPMQCRALVRSIASAVAAEGRTEDRNGPSVTMETESVTACLALVRGEAILMIQGGRGLVLVAALDRKAPHRVVTMSCHETGTWLEEIAGRVRMYADIESLTRFCARAA